MAEVLSLSLPRRRGRRPSPKVDPAELEVLTIPQALAHARSMGRGMGRERLDTAIATGELAASQDRRLDRYGKPLLRVSRKALEAWLAASLTPFHPAPLPGAPSMKKGPLTRAL